MRPVFGTSAVQIKEESRLLRAQYSKLFPGSTGEDLLVLLGLVAHAGARFLNVARDPQGRVREVAILSAGGALLGLVSPSGEIAVEGVDFRIDPRAGFQRLAS